MSTSLGLTSQTKIDKEASKGLTSIINSLIDNNDSLEFREPVDFKALGLVDYPQIVKHPMDLGTVKKNFRANKYKFLEEVLNDLQLVWDNCKLYNAEGSWIYKKADKLEKYMRKVIKNFLPSIVIKTAIKGSKETNNDDEFNDLTNDAEGEIEDQEAVPYKEKLSLSQKVKQLSQEQLGHIVKIIQEECPEAFKEIEKDKFQILVDNISKETFQKIYEVTYNQFKANRFMGLNPKGSGCEEGEA